MQIRLTFQVELLIFFCRFTLKIDYSGGVHYVVSEISFKNSYFQIYAESKKLNIDIYQIKTLHQYYFK